MQWEFTGEQVVKGEVGYTLEEFRKDYYEEIKANFPEFDDQEADRMFRIAYDVCYCVATNRQLSELVKHLRTKEISSDEKYLELIRDSNAENIAMLRAIFAATVSAYLKMESDILDFHLQELINIKLRIGHHQMRVHRKR